MSGLTKRQQELRRTGIGASQIAALAGLSNYATPIAIYEEKLGMAPELDSYAVDLGLEIEAPIARVWAKRMNRAIAYVDTLRHNDPTKHFAVATPDRAVYPTVEARGDGRVLKTDVRDAEMLLQVKSTNWRMRHLWGDEGSDVIPSEYLCQAHWEGSVAGLQQVEFAVDFDKTKLFTYRVIVDRTFFEGLYEIAERFMIDHVRRRVPPPPDASERYGEFISRLFPRDTLKDFEQVPPDAPIMETVHLFARLKSAEKRLEAWKQLARNRIAARIGAAPGIVGTFGKISFKATKQKTVTDWKAVADEALRIAGSLLNVMPEGDMRAALAEDVRKLIDVNTHLKPGFRMMRPTWSDEVKALAEEPFELPALPDASPLATGEEVEQGDEP